MAIIPGLMTVSYGHSFREGKMTPQRLMDRTEELGLKSCEWCHFPCNDPGKVDWDQVKLLDRLGREKGIRNSLAGWAPLLAEDDRQDLLIGRTTTQLEVSRFIGSKRLRFHSSVEAEIGIGTRPPMKRCIENLKRVVALGEKEDIVIALENHGDFTVGEFRQIFAAIDSPYLGINLDTGNFIPLGEDIVAFANEFAQKIVSCHFKSAHFTWTQQGIILTSCPTDRSIIDLQGILKVLDESPREIPAHVEVICLTSEEEDPLVEELARYVHNYLAAKK